MTEITKDAFFDGRLLISQSLNGYRFSIDAVLLAGALRPKRGETVLDLGTGCGIVPLILATRHPDIQLLGVEVQPELARLALLNIKENCYEGRVKVRQVDMTLLPDKQTPGPFDWVVTNPPYRRPHAGRVNPNEQRAMARFEINVDLDQLLQTAGRLLRTGGRFVIVYTAERTVDLIVQMRRAAIEPKSMQAIQSHAGEPAKLVLVQGVKNGRAGLCVAAPLIVYGADGHYTESVQALMRP